MWKQKAVVRMDDLRKNGEGYQDPTAYKGMQTTVDLESKVAFLIKVLKFIIRQSGFELVGRIQIRDKETGRIFK